MYKNHIIISICRKKSFDNNTTPFNGKNTWPIGQHSHHTLPSLTCCPIRVGGGWGLKLSLWRWDPGKRERTQVGCRETGWGGCGVSMRVRSEGVCARTESQRVLVAGEGSGVGMRRGQDHRRNFFPCVCALKKQDTTYRSSGERVQATASAREPMSNTEDWPCCPGRAQAALPLTDPKAGICMPSGEQELAATPAQPTSKE